MSTSDRAGFVYVIQDEHGLCKIGRARNVKTRLQTLATASSSELTLIAAWPADDAAVLEAEHHQRWREHRVRGEWFSIPEAVVAAWKSAPAPADVVTGNRSERRDGELAKHTPKGDGVWWFATGKQTIDCPRCGRKSQDAPAAMKYVRGRDFAHIQAKEHPLWVARGWVIWRQCEHCSWMDYRTEYQTLEVIQRWRVGPWWTR